MTDPVDGPSEGRTGASSQLRRSRAGVEQLAWVLVLYLAGVLAGLLLARMV